MTLTRSGLGAAGLLVRGILVCMQIMKMPSSTMPCASRPRRGPSARRAKLGVVALLVLVLAARGQAEIIELTYTGSDQTWTSPFTGNAFVGLRAVWG